MDKKTIVEQVCSILPTFRSFGEEYLNDFYDEALGTNVSLDMSALAVFVGEAFSDNKDMDFSQLFLYLEEVLVGDDEKAADAVATCFLENLINKSSHGEFSSLKFVKLLGPESREYCKAWDEFTGATTEGLE